MRKLKKKVEKPRTNREEELEKERRFDEEPEEERSPKLLPLILLSSFG
jgi:hypothetical protein